MRHFPLVLAWALAAAPGARAAAPVAAHKPSSLTKEAVLNHLNETTHWHRLIESATPWIVQPSDEIYWISERNTATQAIKLAFDAARAEVPLLGEAGPAQSSASALRRRKISEAEAARAASIREDESEISALESEIRAAPTADAAAVLRSRRDALAAEVELLGVMTDTLRTLGASLGSGPGARGGAAGLEDQIDALQRSVSEVFGATQSAAPKLQNLPDVEAGGLIRRTLALFTLVKSLHGIKDLTVETDRLLAAMNQVWTPVLTADREIASQADRAPQILRSARPTEFVAIQRNLEAMTAKFRVLSAVSVPLIEERALLEQSDDNLAQWHNSVHQLFSRTIADVLLRTGSIVAMLAVVLGVSHFWGRMAFRYFQDERRRRQFLLMRRIITGVLMVCVIVIGFISDISSLATFGGIIGAGLAVALQTIILSIAAYFFMIGRSGLRAGDRVTIAGVTGEVVHVGPVRFYLRELTGDPDNLRPTGRVAIFSNAVIFQHIPIFRPMKDEKHLKTEPGTKPA